MKEFVPRYYNKFACKAGDCKHSCCVGWEIDIDDKTLEKYKALDGDIGNRLRGGINYDAKPPCFSMDERGNCPFFNSHGLCDIISELGYDYISDICREHPRFYNTFSDRLEIGIGMCCEAAAELVIGETEPFQLVCANDGECNLTDWENELIQKRERAIKKITDRSLDLKDRIAWLDTEYGIDLYKHSLSHWCEFYSELEYMDDAMPRLLKAVDATVFLEHSDDLPHFNIAFEQIISYLLFRHLSAAEDADNLRARVGLCLVSFRMIRAMALTSGPRDASDIAETCRIYSSEIEYSEENTETIIGEFTEF